MRITVTIPFSQLSALLLMSLFLIIFNFSSCRANKEEKPVIPPVTSPLTREYIGFGVITSSFTHITEDPAEDSRSLGYLRRGSLVRIIRRQVIKTQDVYVSWVLTDGKHNESESEQLPVQNAAQLPAQSAAQLPVQGWLKEDIMEIYDNESKARTASESILKQ